MPRPPPKKNRSWLKEIERAYEKAELKIAKSVVPIEDIYEFAAQIAGARRGIDPETIEASKKQNRQSILRDRALENRGEYVFEFYMCYLDSNEYYGFIDGLDINKILEYVCSEGDVFMHDYDEGGPDV